MRREPESRFSRVPYIAACTVRMEGREVRGLICNLSVLGLYVQVDPVPDQDLELLFNLPDGGEPIEATASVTWVNDVPPDSMIALPVGCGLRFLEMAPADHQRVERVVRAFQAQPEPLVGLAQPRSGLVRVPWISPCTVTGAFGSARGTTCNLSAAGVYVAVEPVPEVGQKVSVSLALPRHRKAFQRDAVVTWQNLERPDRPHAMPPGCGLRFEGLSDPDRALLSSLVSEYLVALATGD